MRETKYRFWDKENMVMIDGRPVLMIDSSDGEVYDVSKGEYQPHLIVMQWTGLTDRNGKELFESDIFTAPHKCGPAGFQQQQGIVTFHAVRGYQWEYWKLDELEIIGNIFQNQELING